MTKAELIERVAGRLEISESQAEAVVNTIFDSMAAPMCAGECIEIPGFGVFEVLEDEGNRGAVKGALHPKLEGTGHAGGAQPLGPTDHGE